MAQTKKRGGDVVAKQRLLNCSYELKTFINLLPLAPEKDGTRGVSVQLQRMVLRYLSVFEQSNQCWQSAADIANTTFIQQESPGITDRTVGAVLRVLEKNGWVQKAKGRYGNQWIRSLNRDLIKMVARNECSSTTTSKAVDEIDANPSVQSNDTEPDLRSYSNRTDGPSQTGPAVLVEPDLRSYSNRTYGPSRPGPAVLFHTTSKELEKELSIQPTTNNVLEADWLFVVGVLKSFRLDKAEYAAAAARARGLSIDDAFRLMAYYRRESSDDPTTPMSKRRWKETDLRGHLFNWLVDEFSAPDKALRFSIENYPSKWERCKTEIQNSLDALLESGFISQPIAEMRLRLARAKYELAVMHQFGLSTDELSSLVKSLTNEVDSMVSEFKSTRCTPVAGVAS